MEKFIKTFNEINKGVLNLFISNTPLNNNILGAIKIDEDDPCLEVWDSLFECILENLYYKNLLKYEDLQEYDMIKEFHEDALSLNIYLESHKTNKNYLCFYEKDNNIYIIFNILDWFTNNDKLWFTYQSIITDSSNYPIEANDCHCDYLLSIFGELYRIRVDCIQEYNFEIKNLINEINKEKYKTDKEKRIEYIDEYIKYGCSGCIEKLIESDNYLNFDINGDNEIIISNGKMPK